MLPPSPRKRRLAPAARGSATSGRPAGRRMGSNHNLPMSTRYVGCLPAMLAGRPDLGEVLVKVMSLGLVLVFAASAAAAQDAAAPKRGEALVTKNCARCHATARTGESTHPEAPAFRTLGKRYPIEALEEALGEGIISGHPDMPEFTFESAEVGAIIAYLKSIQER
jgi:cytochrome c